MDASFKGVAERFHVSLVSDEGYGSERVTAEIGLDGVFISSRETQRMLRKYPLNHISRWALRDSSLVLYTKTPVDVEEITVTLQGDDRTIRSALDTLTSCCMQLVELLQNRGDHSTEANETTTNLNALIKGGGQSKQALLPSAEDVEYWHGEEKAGWLQSQGDHIKTWRRRWFVLKAGYMFRFATPDVSPSTKPRGLVDLSKVSDVTPAKDATGRNNSLMLSTPTGRVLYVADSETEQVEWLSAIEGAVQKLVRQIAGVEDDPAPAPAPKKAASSISGNQWAQQLEKSYGAVSVGGGGDRKPAEPRSERNTMVNIVGYNQDAPGRAPAAQPSHQGDYGKRGSSFGYDNIAGIAGIRNTGFGGNMSNSSSSYTDSFVKVDYPAYPSLTPTPAQPAQSGSHSQQHPHYGAAQKHAGSYGSSHGSYAPDYGQQPQQRQENSASPYQPHGQPTSYSDYSAQAQQAAPSAMPSYDAGAYGYQQPVQHTQQAQQQQAAYQQPAVGSHTPPSWQQLQTDAGQPYYYNAATGITQWERPAGFA